jgi:Myosin-like coiled-coil protein
MTKNWYFSSIRVRLKEVLHQYELRERHFECIIRSKELEVLLSRARAAEQKQLAEGEKSRANKQDEEVCTYFPRHAWLSIFSELRISDPSPLLERIDSAAKKGYRGSTKRANKAH